MYRNIYKPSYRRCNASCLSNPPLPSIRFSGIATPFQIKKNEPDIVFYFTITYAIFQDSSYLTMVNGKVDPLEFLEKKTGENREVKKLVIKHVRKRQNC